MEEQFDLFSNLKKTRKLRVIKRSMTMYVIYNTLHQRFAYLIIIKECKKSIGFVENRTLIIVEESQRQSFTTYKENQRFYKKNTSFPILLILI